MDYRRRRSVKMTFFILNQIKRSLGSCETLRSQLRATGEFRVTTLSIHSPTLRGTTSISCRFLLVTFAFFSGAMTASAQRTKTPLVKPPISKPAIRLTKPATKAIIGNAVSETRAVGGVSSAGVQSGTVNSPNNPTGSRGQNPEAAVKIDPEIQKVIDVLRTLPMDERQAMVAYYKDLGIEVSASLDAASGAAAGGPTRQLMRYIRTVSFIRRPEAVLDARGKIGLVTESLPAEDATDQEIIQWFHRHAMAAEWDAVKAVLVLRAGREAESLYASMIQGTNHIQSELIPEDVLGLSEAAPTELSDWQVDALAGLLKKAATKTSTQPLIEQFRKGTTWFGSKNDEQRDRTVRLLLAADLPIDAYEFMPSLEIARSEENASVTHPHCRATIHGSDG